MKRVKKFTAYVNSLESALIHEKKGSDNQKEQAKSAEQAVLVNRLLDILNDIFSNKNLLNFWSKEVSVVGKLNSYRCGSRIDIGEYEPVKISVPRGVFGAWKALNSLKVAKKKEASVSDVSKASALKEVCREVNKRLSAAGKKKDKSTEVLYSQIIQFMENGELNLTEDKLNLFIYNLKRTPMFNALELNNESYSLTFPIKNSHQIKGKA